MRHDPFGIRRTPVKRKRSKPRRGPMRDAKYRAWIRTLECVCCFQNLFVATLSFEEWLLYFSVGRIWPSREIECAHVGIRGLAQKSSDREAIPLCAQHHRLGKDSHHRLGKKFWEHHGLDRDVLVAGFNDRYEEERAA